MGIDLNGYVSGEYMTTEDVLNVKSWTVIHVEEKEGEKKLEVILETSNSIKRKMTLNQTNLKALIEMFGTDSTTLLGKMLSLKVIDTEYKGEPAKGIRIDIEETRKLN